MSQFTINKYRHLIEHGISQALDSVPFHGLAQAPVSRRLFSGEQQKDTVNRKHIVVHEISDVEQQQRAYCSNHVHDCDEVNLILSSSSLVYEITLGDESYTVEAPACIHIPAGLPHSANVISGSGYYIAIVETTNYQNSLLNEGELEALKP